MNPYFEQKILSVDPIELIRLVYQRALSCVTEAREHVRHRRIPERSAAIMRAYMAIHELLCALEPEVAPELCERLKSLYLYMQQRLLEANARQEDPPLAEVLKLLTTLAEAWSGVAEELALQRIAQSREVRDDHWKSRSHETSAVPSYALTA
jgi:flagellar secretion chaperone FliS